MRLSCRVYHLSGRISRENRTYIIDHESIVRNASHPVLTHVVMFEAIELCRFLAIVVATICLFIDKKRVLLFYLKIVPSTAAKVCLTFHLHGNLCSLVLF